MWREGGHADASETAEVLRTQLSAHPLGRAVRRVVAVVAAQGTGRGMSALQHFTFRPGDDGFVEERVSRGLHPMMGKRLQLWRLSNFQVERLPSSEDVYLFHGVARSNPKDERLFAFAEVRDLTPMRNEQGAIVSLPDLERQYLETLAAIRLFQSRRSARRRLHWNRVVLYVWPPIELAMNEPCNGGASQRARLPAISPSAVCPTSDVRFCWPMALSERAPVVTVGGMM